MSREGDLLVFDVPHRLIPLIKQMPGAKYTGKNGLWRTPLTWAHLVQARGIFGDKLEPSDEVTEWSWHEYNGRVLPAQEARDSALDPNWTLNRYGDPRMASRPFQGTGVDFMVAAQSAILADDRGLGKSFMSLRTVDVLDAWPMLIICPKTAKIGTWADEIEKWYPDKSVVVVPSTGVAKTRALQEEPDIMIVNFEQTLTGRIARYGSIRLTDKDRTDGPLNREWGSVVVDEAHRMLGQQNKTTRAIWAIGERARHRYALSGTPVANNVGQLWSLLRFISPEEWPSRTQYIERYCETMHNGFGLEITGLKQSNKEELFKSIDCRLLRRTKALVAPDLPPKIHQTVFVEMAPKQKKAYDSMKKDQVTVLEDGEIIAAFDPLTKNARLGMFSKAYCEVDAEGKITMSMPSSTVDALVEIVEDYKPVVVFSQSKKLINLCETELEKKGYITARITGDENENRRAENKRRFNNNEADVMLCTMGAGSESIDLTHASTLVFLLRDYSAVHNPQAEDRIHRLNQTADRCLIIDIVTQDSVDEDIVPALETKYDQLEEVVRDKDSLRKAGK